MMNQAKSCVLKNSFKSKTTDMIISKTTDKEKWVQEEK